MKLKDYANLKEMLIDFNEYSTDYTKTRCKELEKTIENTLEEIERLNNIINELEKWLEEDYNKTLMYEIADYPRYYLDTFEKILKGNDK